MNHVALAHAGQRVLVTAAASGIGLAIAQAFLRAGARVWICDVDAEALSAAIAVNPELAGAPCDVADEASVQRWFDAGMAYLGGIDVLVNNAGIAGPTTNVNEISYADWRRCLAVNLDAAFLCSRLAAPRLRAQRSGAIINMSSTGGQYGFPRRAPYASAKWAIRGFTRTLAQELGPFNVRVNCICPGSVAGERIERVIAAEAAKTGLSLDEVRTRMTSESSMRQFVTAEDIANTALFLCSPAGARISGQDITVDGHTETL